MPADLGLLGESVPAARQQTPLGQIPNHGLLDDLLDHNRGRVWRRLHHRVNDFFNVRRRVERLAEFAAVPIQRVGFHAHLPRQHVGIPHILDRGLDRQIDRLADRAAQKRLRHRHHQDVAIRRNEPLAVFAAPIGAIEDGVVLGLEMWRALGRHRPAHEVICGVDVML